jgi:4-amino-4-deoxy-L-arabinose transferase-like glycosyltransferase
MGRFSSRALLLLVSVAFTFQGLDAPFGNGDEVVYAEHVRAMQLTGRYFELLLYGLPDLQRPALPFTLAAFSAELIPGELGHRLLSALSSLAICGLLFAFARRRHGREDVAWIAVLCCLLPPTFHTYSRALMSDPLFALGTTVALLAVCEAFSTPRSLVGAGVGLGFATACKSLAVMVPALSLSPFVLAVVRRHRAHRELARALLALLVLAAPFYAWGLWTHGEAFFREHFLYSLISRASGGLKTGSMGGPLSYLLWLRDIDGLGYTLTVSASCVACLLLARKTRDAVTTLLPAVWISELTLYSLLSARLPHYLLPAYPVAALCVAEAFAAGVRPLQQKSGLLAAASPVLLVSLVLLGADPASSRVLLMPSPEAHALGLAAHRAVPRRETIYLHGWYAPALAYYAERPFELLVAPRDRRAAFASVSSFEKAGKIVEVPPAPRPRAATLWVAGEVEELAATSWLGIDEVVAREGDHALVRGRAR